MRGLRAALTEHRHFLIVVTLLTLLLTYPTIAYVLKTDGFHLPTGRNSDVFIKLWDAWYAKQILTGQADRFFTNLIFYPEGLSLAFHPLFTYHGLVINALQIFLPLSDAYCLAFLLIIISCSAAAYLYFTWLFNDKWTALFGAVIFGFAPQVAGLPGWPEVAWIAPLPLAIYCLHRGLRERRGHLMVLAGLVAGLSAEVTIYCWVVLNMSVGLFICAMAASRWRERAFWRLTLVFIVAAVLSSAWRTLPMFGDWSALEGALAHRDTAESYGDILSFVVHPPHPVLGPLADALFQISDEASIGSMSYLGFLPLVMVGIGLSRARNHRRTLPWLSLLLVFFLLHLGDTLTINGTEYEMIKLPKYYLDQFWLSPTGPFTRTNHFMAGIGLPLAVLACFGLATLKERFPSAAQPRFIMALVLIVAFEYWVPVEMRSSDPLTGRPLSRNHLAFLDWLDGEDAELRLINLPFGRDNAKRYIYYQSLSGYPQTEGAISRPPASVYDYIRANPVLRIWHEQRPTNCVIQDRVEYLEGLTQLAEDGFTHVIHHYGFYFWERQIESFRYVDPAYSDDYVSIYRLEDLLESCPS